MKMKRVLVFLIVLFAAVLGIFSQDQLLWCTRLFTNEPRIHTIQKGQSLSKLSEQYYGTPDYWKELALINRAPNPNKVYPGEDVIIPSQEAVAKIRNTKHLSRVNGIVTGQENWISQNMTKSVSKLADKVESLKPIGSQPAIQPAPAPASRVEDMQGAAAEPALKQEVQDPPPPQESSVPFILVLIAGVLVISSIAARIIQHRKKKAQIAKLEEAFADEPYKPKRRYIATNKEDKKVMIG
jgi:hypothetical protein